jgi:putative phosphoribosyl transferase
VPELRRRRTIYQAGRPAPDLTGRTVIVVDDGIATGATMRAALRLLRAAGAGRLVLATPVAPRDVLDALAPEADETVCLETPSPFYSVGMHYGSFEQLEDAEVTAILARNRGPAPT